MVGVGRERNPLVENREQKRRNSRPLEKNNNRDCCVFFSQVMTIKKKNKNPKTKMVDCHEHFLMSIWSPKFRVVSHKYN